MFKLLLNSVVLLSGEIIGMDHHSWIKIFKKV